MIFGKRLRERREHKNLTQKELADRLFLGESTISFYEAGKRQPKYEILEKIADILDTTTDYLLGRTDNPEFNQVTDREMLKELEEARKAMDEATNRYFKIAEKHSVKKEISPD